ncbi:hypothetical protein F4808DRAFT_71260 [Astrocystis sublimbata]|nr:hypothetical protein F4808DRAFT_71260 [Astrocystis sublimbata]
MENPAQDISHVIHSLTEGTRDEQQQALDDYFLPEAYFVHPLCRVPSFPSRWIEIPFTNFRWAINSRLLVSWVYQWYKILSPKITLQVDSTAFDKNKNLLYATVRQTFTLWIVPYSLWQTEVSLVCLLELAHLPVDENMHPLAIKDGANAKGIGNNAGVPKKRYFIRGQQDNYQPNDWLSFVAPFGAYTLVFALQLFATLLCAIGVMFLWPVTSVYERISVRPVEAHPVEDHPVEDNVGAAKRH